MIHLQERDGGESVTLGIMYSDNLVYPGKSEKNCAQEDATQCKFTCTAPSMTCVVDRIHWTVLDDRRANPVPTFFMVPFTSS